MYTIFIFILYFFILFALYFCMFVSICPKYLFQEVFINSFWLVRHGIGNVYRIVIRPRKIQERKVSKAIRYQTIEQFDNRSLIELNWSVVLVFTTSWLVGLRLLCWSDNSRAQACAPLWLTILDERPRVSHRFMLSLNWNCTSIDIPQIYLLWATLYKLCRNIEHIDILITNYELFILQAFYIVNSFYIFNSFLIYTINIIPIFECSNIRNIRLSKQNQMLSYIYILCVRGCMRACVRTL